MTPEATKPDIKMQTPQQQDDDRPMLTVHGIYSRGDVPRKETIPEDYGLKDLDKDQIMVRKRRHGIQKFIPEHGLVAESHDIFYHNDVEAHDDDDDSDDEEEEEDPFDYPLERTDRIYEERTVLMQSLENYQMIKDHPSFSELMPDNLNDVLDDVRFGENMIVSGLDHKGICIGDVFQVSNGDSKVKFQVTSPRLPCSYVDRRNGSKYGMKGLRRHTMSEGLAGWFVRVLEKGTLEEGMKLVRIENPHPKWNLQYISRTLYAEVDRKHYLMCWAQWDRSKKELEELCALPALGWYEWKAEAQWLLDRWGREDVVVEPNKKMFQQKILPPATTACSSMTKLLQRKPSRVMSSVFSLSPGALQSRHIQWLALAVFGLTWLTVGHTLVLLDYP